MPTKAIFFGACLVAFAACGGREQTLGTPGPGSGNDGSGGGTPQAPAGPPIAQDQFFEQIATAFCDGMAPCCEASGIAYDSATCKKAAMAHVTDQLIGAISPAARYNAAAAGQCRDALAGALVGCGGLDSNAALLKACNAVFTGSQPPGATCSANSDCARPDGRYAVCEFTYLVDTNGGPVSSACAVEQLHAKAGDPCQGVCPSASSSCIDSNASTAVCYIDDGLYCSFPGGANSGTCQPLAKLGDACRNGGCVESAFCETLQCTTGMFCNTSVCTARRDTGPCTGNPDACTPRSYCSMNPSQPGGPISFQCLPKQPDGGKCLGPPECLSGYCDMSSNPTDGGDLPQQGVCVKKTFISPATCAGAFR